MKIPFTKAQASGNDFIILDNRAGALGLLDSKHLTGRGKIADFGRFAASACRRKYSVGADGLLILEDSKDADFKMRIFNPDGTEVTMCGNGVRASALYAYRKEWCGGSMTIETGAGILEAEVNRGSVKVKMTTPADIKLNQNIGVGKTIMNVHTLDTGVPHVVHFVDDVEKYPVREMGGKIRYHKVFEPDGTNADFVQISGKSTITVRTYERGVEDETLACGTGVVASAVISNLINGTEPPVSAVTKSGDVLTVHFNKERDTFRDVYLEGKACIIFNGEVNYV